MSIYMSIHMSIHTPIHMSIHMPIHMSIHTPIHMLIHIPIHMPIHISIHMPIHMSVHMSIHMSIHMSAVSILACQLLRVAQHVVLDNKLACPVEVRHVNDGARIRLRIPAAAIEQHQQFDIVRVGHDLFLKKELLT